MNSVLAFVFLLTIHGSEAFGQLGSSDEDDCFYGPPEKVYTVTKECYDSEKQNNPDLKLCLMAKDGEDVPKNCNKLYHKFKVCTWKQMDIYKEEDKKFDFEKMKDIILSYKSKEEKKVKINSFIDQCTEHSAGLDGDEQISNFCKCIKPLMEDFCPEFKRFAAVQKDESGSVTLTDEQHEDDYEKQLYKYPLMSEQFQF